MKKILYVAIAILTFCSNKSFSQQVIYEDDAIAEIGKWLPAGQYDFQVLEKDVSPALKEIIKKYQKSLSDNPVWYQSYKEQHPTLAILPYHKNFGITQAEYQRFNTEYPKLKTRVRTAKAVSIDNTDQKIAFKGADDFKFLDGVVFDKKKNKMLVDTLITKYQGNVTESDTATLGAYNGYKWKYEKGNYDAVKALKSPDYTCVELTVSKTPANKTLFILKVMTIENLITKINSTISGYMVTKQ